MRLPPNKEKNENNKEEINNKKNKSKEYIHDKRRIILPRIFHESLIRAALLFYSNSKDKEERNMPLSMKLQKLLNILIPSGLKKEIRHLFVLLHLN